MRVGGRMFRDTIKFFDQFLDIWRRLFSILAKRWRSFATLHFVQIHGKVFGTQTEQLWTRWNNYKIEKQTTVGVEFISTIHKPGETK